MFVMGDIIDFLSNQVVIGWIAPIVIAAIIGGWKLITDEIKGQRIGIPYQVYWKKPVDIFKKYCENNRITPIISYDDSKAITINSEIDKGNIIVRANIDLTRKPQNNDNTHFVMILLKYTPKCNMSYFYKKGYSLMFDIKSEKGISGTQLEVKDINGDKVIDEFLDVSDQFKHYSFKISEYFKVEAWKEINELCFTIFAKNKYIEEKVGNIEIRNCLLKIEK